MAALIDPFLKTVTHWQPAGPFLQALRETIDCKQVDSVMIQKAVALWVDNFGLLQDNQRFFRFDDSPYRFAGRAIMTGVDADGMPCDIPGLNLDGMAQHIDWCDGCSVIRISEELQATPTESLGLWPRVVRVPEFNLPLENKPVTAFDLSPVQSTVADMDGRPEAPQAVNGALQQHSGPAPAPTLADLPSQDASPQSETVPTHLWTVHSDDDTDTFIAHQTEIATGEMTGIEVRFKKMADVASYFAQHEAVRVDTDPDAPDTVVAQFTV